MSNAVAQRAFRSGQIETLRGMACLLLVAFHVIGTPQSGMHVGDDSPWRLITTLFTPVRMPLFAFISGYVFIECTNSRRALWDSLLKKFRRLGIPLVSASLIYDVAYILVGDAKAEYSIVRLLFYPFIHLWFLQSALLIATFVTLLMMVFRLGRPLFGICLFLLAFGLSQFVPYVENDVFSITGMLYLLPFFSLGIVLRGWSAEPLFEHHALWKVRVVLLVIIAGLLVVGWWRSAELPWAGRYDIGNVALSCVVCVALFLMRGRVELLAAIGPFSYTIYLFHPLFSSLSRKLLQHSGHEFSNLTIFLVGMTAGLLAPIAVHKLLSHSKAGAFLLLGVDYRKVSRVAVRPVTDSAVPAPN